AGGKRGALAPTDQRDEGRASPALAREGASGALSLHDSELRTWADTLEGGEQFFQVEGFGQRRGKASLGHLFLLAAADVAGRGDDRDGAQLLVGTHQAQQIVAI